MGKKLTIVGVNGSPRKGGETATLLRKFLEEFDKNGGETHLIDLIDKKINPCLGCYSENPSLCKFPCIQEDDMREIYDLLLKADVIILASPIYWFNMSGLMKNFLDRLTCTANNGYLLEGKIGIVLAVSRENEGGRVNAAMEMAATLNHLGLFIPPYGIMFYPGEEFVTTEEGKVVKVNWVEEDMRKIAKSLISLCEKLEGFELEW